MSEPVLPTMPFDDAKQEAIVAWALHDPLVFDRIRKGLKQPDLSSPHLGRVYKAALDYYERFERLPNLDEIQREHGFTRADKATRDIMVKELNKLPAARSRFGLDLIKRDVENWMKARLTLEALTKFGDVYNQSAKDPAKLEESLKVIPEAALQIESMSFDDGQAAEFESASVRFGNAQKQREDRKYTDYGVSFLDDATGGFTQHEVVLVGAKTGAGKTQLVTAIALGAAKAKKRVAFFALEAEEGEIENRILYSMLASRYFDLKDKEWAAKKNGQVLKLTVDCGHVSYSRWLKGKLEGAFKPFYDEVVAKCQQDYTTLRTYYRTSGTFNVKVLDRHLKRLRDAADIIVIDHIHYVDIEGDNENQEYKQVIKTIRDAALRYGIPVFVVAHLRKTQSFRDKAAVPNLDDFHGTSELTKISTTCILLGRAERSLEQKKNAPYIMPTYMKVAKFRSEGGMTYYAARCDYDARMNKYRSEYTLGTLINGDSKFETITDPSVVPEWAENAIRIKPAPKPTADKVEEKKDEPKTG